MRATHAAATAPDVAVTQADRWLVARFARPHAVVSWAIAGGGLGRADAVAWLQVHDLELAPDVDPRALLAARLAAAGLGGAVGLLTSRRLDRHEDATVSSGGVTARCVATVGLGNALRAGDSPGPLARVGTINLLCHLSAPLAQEALLETLALAAEARTMAVLDAAVASRRSGRPATGTGTDCIVIAAPLGSPAAALRYAGKHTPAGHAVGASVAEAVGRGVTAWLAERRSA